MIHVLHICSDYSQQKLYRDLIIELSKKDIKQTVYVPVRSISEIGRYDIIGVENLIVIYSHILSNKHRLFYYLKIKTILIDIEKKVNLKDIDIVHAHFLFSDGGVAFKINTKYSIPYIVAVRNTDVNVFFKYMLHLRAFGRAIIKASNKVVFITPSYSSLMAQKYLPTKYLKNFIDASIVPNGLSRVWLEDSIVKSVQKLATLKLLYVGDFSRNKNVIQLLNVIKKFSLTTDVELTLAGGGGDDHEKILNLLKRKGFEFASYIGRVEGMPAMKQLYSQHHIFIMISKLETFGLVYLEAMSQGLPVIHTAGQGIDGYFENSLFAIPVNPNSERDIFDAIESVLNNYEEASREARKASKSFLWSNVANIYLKFYNL
jgi:glycosyltransferase involved in cell wall biosynthesis